MEIAQRLALNVRRLRREKGWSQERLAEEAGLHRTYISQVERATQNPTIMAVDRIATALGARAGDLLN